MIISCPSCHTRYRATVPEAPSPETARCSRCEEVFPVDRPAQPYVLVTSAGVPGIPMSLRTAGMSIGMDEPGLAARLGRTALDGTGHDGAAMTYRVEADPEDRTTAEASEIDRPAGPRVLVAVVLALTGGAAGYAAAWQASIDPWGATLAGAVAGLLVSRLGRTWRRGKS